ncbi:MAG: NUDIX hydrolase [Candidatus Doudnabacteria bacterium]|nr:NUDIX hydrolase [Candidatus Doudnabacteria bacterium]
MKKWKKLKSHEVFQNPFYSIYEDEIIRPDGSRGRYYILRKPPGVVVVPFDGKDVYLVEQYRQTFRRRMWELPAGKSEGKTFLAGAKKELKEETGMTGKKWTFLGHFACGPGHTSHLGKMFLAEGLHFGAHNREAGEQDMVVKKFSLPAVDKMIVQGEIIDSWSITSWFLFKQHLLRRNK